ncbi:MAG TPA: hypothetical protein VGG39_23375 [Polyangiaceae bacterium]|jgi:hypothetical protein
MAAKALVGLFEKKMRKPDIEGEPEMEEERGSGDGDGDGDGEAPASSEKPGGYDEHEEMALDDLADIVGVSPEDRGDFGSALAAYVHACVAKALHEQDEEPEEEPEPGDGEEEPEPEEEPRDDEE